MCAKMTNKAWLEYLLTSAKICGITPTSYLEKVKREQGYCRVLWCWAHRARGRSRCKAHLQVNSHDMKQYRNRVEERIVKRVAEYIKKGG